jgi:hypothetical protein
MEMAMNFELSPQEADYLQQLLQRSLRELRGEIAGTESLDWRRGLQGDEQMLKALLDRLGHLAPAP